MIFFVSGMFCGTCGQTVEKSAGRLPGVRSARLNFASKLLKMELEDGADVQATCALIERELERGGFAGKRQTAGWMSTFSQDLEREQAQAVPAWLLATVVFFAMWSSMAAFAKYLGELSKSEEHLLSTISTLVGLPAILLGVIPFARSGWNALSRSRLLTLDLFVALGGLSALAVSLASLWTGADHTYVDSGAMVLVVLLTAKVLEARLTRTLVGRILYHLGDGEGRVERVDSAGSRQVLATQVRRGQAVAFSAGQTVLFDGVLLSPESDLDLHLLSGEAGSKRWLAGASIPAGAVAHGRLEMRVEEPIGHRAIDGWAESALLSQCRPHRYSQALARWERRLTAFALAGACGLGVLRYAQSGDVGVGLEAFFVGVLIFCPCLFVSILPLAKQMAHLALARRGILLQRAECLFDLHGITRIYLDKTGTLQALESVFVSTESAARERAVVSLLADLRLSSEHPVLKGLRVMGEEGDHGRPPRLLESPGSGVQAHWPDSGDDMIVGRPSFVYPLLGLPVPRELLDPVVALNGRAIGTIVTAERYDERALAALGDLLQRLPVHVPIEILSGDPKPEAGLKFQALAPGRIVYHGNLQPSEKADRIAANALYVGDGLNDTLAFAQAAVSLRLGHRVKGFAPVDLQLLGPDIERVVEVWDYSHSFVNVLRQTAFFALSYNLAAWILAAFGYFTPLSAVLAMLTSLLLMIASSLRLLSPPACKKRD